MAKEQSQPRRLEMSAIEALTRYKDKHELATISAAARKAVREAENIDN